MLKRLFIKLPLLILFFLCFSTLIIPLVYWIITDESCTDVLEYIDEL